MEYSFTSSASPQHKKKQRHKITGIQRFCLGTVIFTVAAALIITTRITFADDGRSGIMGKVRMAGSGEPVGSAYVYIYSAESGARAAQVGAIGIAYQVSRGTAEDGEYRISLPPGDYYAVARKRASGLNFGPLRKGDWYDHSTARDAVSVREGEYIRCDFNLRQLTEPMFFQGLTAEGKKTSTGIRGKLLNSDGEHVPGTFVMAFVNDDMRRMPDFTSTVTDDQGNYTLYLPEGGRYWIAARLGYMRAPRRGEPFARFEGSSDHSVLVVDNQFLDGVDLVLRPYERVPPVKPGETGP